MGVFRAGPTLEKQKRRSDAILIQTNACKILHASHSASDIFQSRGIATCGSQPPRLETVLSIQSCTSLLSSRTSRPAASKGGPMTTRTVPGFFIQPRRGQ